MKHWEVTAVWQMIGTYQITAETEEEAREMVHDDRFPLPNDGDYLMDSFEVDSVIELESDLDGEE
jgi:hypothetical protein